MLVRYLMAGALAALAACGSSESGTRVVSDAEVPDLAASLDNDILIRVADPNITLQQSEIEELDDAIDPIASDLVNTSPITPWANVPDSGSVDYVGGIEIVALSDAEQRIFGALTVTANFVDDNISGLARDFYTNDGDANEGTLELTGTIGRDSDLTRFFGIAGELTGDLTGDAFSGEANIPIVADFADTATVIYGGGNGTVGGTDVDAAFVVFEN